MIAAVAVPDLGATLTEEDYAPITAQVTAFGVVAVGPTLRRRHGRFPKHVSPTATKTDAIDHGSAGGQVCQVLERASPTAFRCRGSSVTSNA